MRNTLEKEVTFGVLMVRGKDFLGTVNHTDKKRAKKIKIAKDKMVEAQLEFTGSSQKFVLVKRTIIYEIIEW